MRISVVVTTYNRAADLAVTIEDLLAQTEGDFELIVSDDCSPDATRDVVAGYERLDSRVRYRCNERNLGMPGNLNAALAQARGELVANLHDGDRHSPHLLKRWAGALDACDEAAFVFNAYGILDAAGRTTRVFREPLQACQPGAVLLERIFFRRWRFDSPVRGTVMARRAAYRAAGPFQERFGYWSDVDMWLRLASRHHVAYVDEVLIAVPDARVQPRQFSLEPRRLQRRLERMFWEARRRHYHGRPVRGALEAGRHLAFAAAARGLQATLAAVRAARRLRGRS